MAIVDAGAHLGVRYELHERVALITFDRPDRLNAFDVPAIERLQAVLDEVARNAAIHAVVLTGSGRAFSAGADLDALQGIGSPAEYDAFLLAIQGVTRRVYDLDLPVVAAINGGAYGAGLELVLACDLRLAAPGTKLALSEIKVGLIPAAGGTQWLVRNLPRAIARRMILFGDPLTSEDALALGLVNELVAADDLLPTAMEWAHRLAEQAPLGVRAAKQLMLAAESVDVGSGLAMERQLSGFLFESDDGREGIRAFVEKRKPSFTGT
jgi:enoyl-CoA hydratase